MDVASKRVRRLIERDFPEPGSAQEVGRIVSDVSGTERVQAAVVLMAGGGLARLRQAVRLTAEDWRDVLVGAGLADDDWSAVLDRALETP